MSTLYYRSVLPTVRGTRERGDLCHYVLLKWLTLVTAKNITADLQGRYPWTEDEPLLLTDVSVDVLGGNVLMKQLRMPQHDPALLRLNNLSSSELVSAINPKQFAMSGAFSGALPLWLNNEKWIVKDGWLANAGPMTLRLDKDTADAVAKTI